jgi:hypothetical protein
MAITGHVEPMKIEVSPVMEKPADTVAKASAAAVVQTVTSDTLRVTGSAIFGVTEVRITALTGRVAETAVVFGKAVVFPGVVSTGCGFSLRIIIAFPRRRINLAFFHAEIRLFVR